MFREFSAYPLPSCLVGRGLLLLLPTLGGGMLGRVLLPAPPYPRVSAC